MKKLQITPLASTTETGAITNYRGVDLKIARANNTRFKSIFRQLIKPYKDQIDKNMLDEEISQRIYLEAIAEAILVDWKNFKVEGEEIPYSVENAIELLKNDPDCLEFVNEYSQSIDNYLISDEEEIKGKP